MACRYRVVIEKTTYSIPGLTLGAEDCIPDVLCCDDSPTDIAICDDIETSYEFIGEAGICSPDWFEGNQDGFDTFVDIDLRTKTITLPPGSYEVSKSCETVECGGVDPDCPCE